jgi:hypothetical protein
MAIASSKSRIVHALHLNIELMVSRLQVYLHEIAWSLELIETNRRYAVKVPVVDCQFVQLPIVDTHPKWSIFILTNKTCAPHGEELGLMNPLLRGCWIGSIVLASQLGPIGMAPWLLRCSRYQVNSKLDLSLRWYSRKVFRKYVGENRRLLECLWFLSPHSLRQRRELRTRSIPSVSVFSPWCKTLLALRYGFVSVN